MAFKDTSVSRDTTVDGDHGRIETRTVTVFHDIGWLQDNHQWPGLKSVVMIESERETDGKVEAETRFYITSLALLANALGPMIRSHWMVENGLHWVLDMIFRDDECRVRTDNAPFNLAIVKHSALNVLRTRKSKDSLRMRRKVAAWDENALALATVPLHVHVGGQGVQRRSQLARLVGAVVSLSDAAAADAACVVRRAAAAGRTDIRHRRHVFRGVDLPFLIFCLRRLRFLSAFGILSLQGCILITGNYNWFNLQTMLLCLALFDDAAVRRILPRRLVPLLQSRAENQTPRRVVTVVVAALAVLIVFCSLVEMDERFGGRPPEVAQAVDNLIEPLHIVSSYGLFAVMTTTRNEIVVEGCMTASNGATTNSGTARRCRAPPTWEYPTSAAPGLADVVRRAR